MKFDHINLLLAQSMDNDSTSLKLGTILTAIVVVLASVSALLIVLGQVQENQDEYMSVEYSFSRIALRYDYSCDENVYGLAITLTNNGTKLIQDFNVTITNGLCVGSVPPLPSLLSPGQSIQFYLYSSSPNGTVSVTGNNTDILIHF